MRRPQKPKIVMKGVAWGAWQSDTYTSILSCDLVRVGDERFVARVYHWPAGYRQVFRFDGCTVRQQRELRRWEKGIAAAGG